MVLLFYYIRFKNCDILPIQNHFTIVYQRITDFCVRVYPTLSKSDGYYYLETTLDTSSMLR